MASLEGLTLDADGCFTDRPDCIATWSGGRIAPVNPDVDDIDIRDIARGLANACRWNGQCRFYSVAEHSVHVSRLVPTLEALMHDAPEGYLNDMARPVKMHSTLGDAYLPIEAIQQDAIERRFGLKPLTPEIHAADYAMGFAEAKQLVPHLGALMPPVETRTPALMMWSPDEAYERFLERFTQLGGQW